jgi:hypothetical protein
LQSGRARSRETSAKVTSVQINRALKEHRDWFEKGKVVVAGHFNSNARWDKERRDWNHSTMVDQLRKHNLVSVYHKEVVARAIHFNGPNVSKPFSQSGQETHQSFVVPAISSTSMGAQFI